MKFCLECTHTTTKLKPTIGTCLCNACYRSLLRKHKASKNNEHFTPSTKVTGRKDKTKLEKKCYVTGCEALVHRMAQVIPDLVFKLYNEPCQSTFGFCVSHYMKYVHELKGDVCTICAKNTRKVQSKDLTIPPVEGKQKVLDDIASSGIIFALPDDFLEEKYKLHRTCWRNFKRDIEKHKSNVTKSSQEVSRPSQSVTPLKRQGSNDPDVDLDKRERIKKARLDDKLPRRRVSFGESASGPRPEIGPRVELNIPGPSRQYSDDDIEAAQRREAFERGPEHELGLVLDTNIPKPSFSADPRPSTYDSDDIEVRQRREAFERGPEHELGEEFNWEDCNNFYHEETEYNEDCPLTEKEVKKMADIEVANDILKLLAKKKFTTRSHVRNSYIEKLNTLMILNRLPAVSPTEVAHRSKRIEKRLKDIFSKMDPPRHIMFEALKHKGAGIVYEDGISMADLKIELSKLHDKSMGQDEDEDDMFELDESDEGKLLQVYT